MTAETATKRTRIVNSQSKNGCYTCRARRVKCDEKRPTCLRCERSKQQCLGYRDQQQSPDSQDSSSSDTATWQSSLPVRRLERSPRYALSYGMDGDPLRDRFASLACMVLQHGELSTCGRSGSVWSIDLPRYSCSAPIIAYALAALGSVLDSRFRDPPGGTLLPSPAPAKLYGAAISEMQRVLTTSEQPRECILLACLLLGCAEVVQWREANAMTHVTGAYALLKARRGAPNNILALDPDVVPEDSDVNINDDTFEPRDDLDILFVLLDLQTASYALGLPPRLPRIDLQFLLSTPENERQHSNLELRVIQAVHSAYRVAQALSDYKYLPRHHTPNHLAFEQARTIAQLFACLHDLCRYLKELERHTRRDQALWRTAIVLRTQCLAALIYLSMNSQTAERGYDAYAPYFQQIVTDAEELLLTSTSGATTTDDDRLYGHFSIGLGIMQSLFLTATKYRDPNFRRRAIALLRKGGREGPWYGKLLAIAAARAVEFEELDFEARGEVVRAAGDVSEEVRLHGIGFDIKSMVDGNAVHIDMIFTRPYDVDALVSGTKKWDDESLWERMTETVDW